MTGLQALMDLTTHRPAPDDPPELVAFWQDWRARVLDCLAGEGSQLAAQAAVTAHAYADRLTAAAAHAA